MVSRHIGQRWLACRVLVLLVAVFAALAVSAEDDPKSKERLEIMQAAVNSLEAKSSELKPNALAAAPKPLLRYNDPTRGGVGVDEKPMYNVLLDAGVWRLGTEGRPTAIITLEIYRGPTGAHVLSYEFLSLTEAKFSLKHKTEKVLWEATASGLELKSLPEAPKPAATAAARLTQMRQLARRFAAKEKFNNETIECRLIAQPIDRYSSDAQKIVDGALFALANGTNPEIGIVLEADAENWRYGVLRFTSAETTVTLDDKPVVTFEKFNARGRKDGPYNSGSHLIELGK